MKIIEAIAMLMPLLAAAPGLVFGEQAQGWGLLIVVAGLICTWLYLNSNTQKSASSVKGAVAFYLFFFAADYLYDYRDLDSAVCMATVIMLCMALFKESDKGGS